ncbi:MAG TPA: hypothetical protein VGH81_14860 [Rudaea sp.]|jgi:hypothetical protein
MAIEVKLNTAASPPVTVQPRVHSVNHGNQTIEWVPFAQENFTFVSLTGLPNPPFSTPTVTDTKITVTDDNQNAGSAVDYFYTIVVCSDGVEYSSAPSRISGGSSDPTIKNK